MKRREHKFLTRAGILLMVLLALTGLTQNGFAAETTTEPVCYEHGDVNGDGKVDSKDAIHALYHSVYPDESQYSVNQSCDFTGEGDENAKDAIYLLYGTFDLFKKDYPLEGHIHQYYEPVWTWNEDNTAQVSIKCGCGEVISYTSKNGVTVTESDTEATCTTAGSVVYTAKVTVGDQELTNVKTVEIPATGHNLKNPNDVTTDATACEGGVCVNEGCTYTETGKGHVDMKKIAVFVCIMALLCGLTSVQAAEGSARLTYSGLDENGIIYVTVHLSGGITGDTMGITYHYDTSVLETVKSECHWVSKGVLQDINTARNEGVWASSEPKKLDGEVCVLAFRVKAGATLTASSVNCEVIVKNGKDKVGEFSAAVELKQTCTHTYGEWEKQGEMGHMRSCTLCGKSQIQSHEWNEGAVAADPKNPDRNIRTRTCTVCGETKEEYEKAEPTETEQTHPTEPARPEETTPAAPEPTVTEQTRPEPTPPNEQPNHPGSTNPEPTTPTEGQPEPTAPESKPTPTAPGNSDMEATTPENPVPNVTEPENNQPDPTAPGNSQPDPTAPGNSKPESDAPGIVNPEATEPEKQNPGNTEPTQAMQNTPQSGQIGPDSQLENQPGQQTQKPGQGGNQNSESSQQNASTGNTPQQGTIGPGQNARPEQETVTGQPQGDEEDTHSSVENDPHAGHDHSHEEKQSGLISESVPEVLPAPNAPDSTLPVNPEELAEISGEDSVIGPIVAVLMLAAAGAAVMWYLGKRKRK